MDDEVRRLLRRADDVRKAAPGRADPEAARATAMALLEQARELLQGGGAGDGRRELAAQVARRIADLDRDELPALLGPTPGVARAPTRVDDPARIPPGQHLTAGWPVLHVGPVPDVDLATWRMTVTGLVDRRLVFTWDELRSLPSTTVTRDFHCVTRWSRPDNTWTGVRVDDLLARAGVRPAATHAVVTGRPAYAANLPLDVLRADDVLLAWDHDGQPLPPAHGGPLRLVVPSRYGWKSVKWVFELRLLDRDVPGYWEERGYHDDGDPWREQRFRGD